MSEIDLEPQTFQRNTLFERMFQMRNPDGIGILRLVLDGSVTTDRDINSGSVFVDFVEPDGGEIYAGQIPLGNEEPHMSLWDDENATLWVRRGMERLEKLEREQLSA